MRLAVSLAVFHQAASLRFTLCLRLFAVAVHRRNFFSGRPAYFACFHGGTHAVDGNDDDDGEEQCGQTGIDLVVEDDLRHFADVFSGREDFVFSQCVAVFAGMGKEADARVAVEQFLQTGVAGYKQYADGGNERSEERRVGKECSDVCSSDLQT